MWLIYPVMLLWSKLIFPLQEGYQLQIIYWLWVWPHVYFLLSVLRSCLAWNCAALVHKCCTLCKPPSVSILLSMEDTVSVSPPLLLSFQTLCLLFCIDPSGSWEEDLMKTSTYNWVLQTLSLSVYCPGLGLCVYSHVLQEELLLMCSWDRRYSKMSLRIILLLYSFSGIIVVGFSLGPWPI